jgi:hypothetical protein
MQPEAQDTLAAVGVPDAEYGKTRARVSRFASADAHAPGCRLTISSMNNFEPGRFLLGQAATPN